MPSRPTEVSCCFPPLSHSVRALSVCCPYRPLMASRLLRYAKPLNFGPFKKKLVALTPPS